MILRLFLWNDAEGLKKKPEVEGVTGCFCFVEKGI